MGKHRLQHQTRFGPATQLDQFVDRAHGGLFGPDPANRGKSHQHDAADETHQPKADHRLKHFQRWSAGGGMVEPPRQDDRQDESADQKLNQGNSRPGLAGFEQGIHVEKGRGGFHG